jgi:hypothetical protein
MHHLNQVNHAAALTKESHHAQTFFISTMVCYLDLFVRQESGTGQTAASGYLMLSPAVVSSQEQPFSFKNSVGCRYRKDVRADRHTEI